MQKQRKEEAVDTLKAVALKENENSSNLLALSVCDAKPAHFIENCLNEIKWIEKKNESLRLLIIETSID